MFNTDLKKIQLYNQCSAMQHCHENHVHMKLFESLKSVAKGCNYCFYDIMVFGSAKEENNYLASLKSQKVHPSSVCKHSFYLTVEKRLPH